MNDIKKRIAAVAAVLCVAFCGVTGCSSKNKESSETPIEVTPFSFGLSGDTISVDTPVVPEGSEKVIENVTDASGQPVTEVIYNTETVVQPVTDEAGQPVTDEQGQEVTEEVVQNVTEADGQPVTEIVQMTTEVDKTANNAVSGPMQCIYATWIDISKKSDYLFEGDMMVATLKVKDDVPAGDYTIKVTTDFANYDAKSLKVAENISGTVRVGGGTIEADEHADDTRFIYYAKNAACNAGDEVQIYFTIRNNPGVVAFMNKFYFDTTVFEFVDLETCGEYETIASQTAVGAVDAK